ncbi:MAG: DUF3891 family protein [Acidobacteriota bacterium]|nr:DUF3891 family protein [Acidobacteriota bacterium]
MLRLETETGWWLVTHPDHARLAGAFARQWGNTQFCRPEPREHVLRGIASHDDGWALRDATPQITRQGLPSAFSVELVGKYSAFEEIDLLDYLNVRERAVEVVAQQDPYAGLLVSLHTYNLLTERADRATIQPDQLPLLDAFLERQRDVQQQLRAAIQALPGLTAEDVDAERVQQHFRLLQATDNLSLLACVDDGRPGSLLHPLPCNDGTQVPVAVQRVAPRCFRLAPYPFAAPLLEFALPARHVAQKRFASAAELQAMFAAAPMEQVTITVRA